MIFHCVLLGNPKTPKPNPIHKGAHQEQNQPVPVQGLKTFCYRALNINLEYFFFAHESSTLKPFAK